MCNNSAQAWNISGNCPEPEPIINTYNDVQSNRVIYSCFPGTTHDSGHLEITCDVSGPDPEYVGDWPHCSTDCGEPLNWARAPISNLSGTRADDYIIYKCAHGNGTDTIAFCTEANGWEMVYPVCTNSTNWAEEMVRVTSLGFGNISDDSCFYVQNETDHPWISVRTSDSNPLLDIIFIGAEIKESLDNKWMNNVSASFWRDSTLIAEVDASVLPGYETSSFSLHLENYILAVNEVRLTSNEENFIGACRFEIFGQATETGCPEVAIPPFKTRVLQYVSRDSVLLECDNGFIYIGGNREMECTYKRVWEITHSVFMECTDRRNYALDSNFTVNIQEGDSYNYLFEGKFDGNNIQDSGIFTTIGSLAEDVEIIVELENKVAIERVVVECDGYRVPNTVSVSNTADFNTQKQCLESRSYEYEKSHVFFCGVHPVGRFIKIRITAQQTISESWNISYTAIIGIEIQNEIVPECTIEARGQDYKGFLNYTNDGTACSHWSDHLQYSDLEQFPDETLDDAKNFCRNPDPSHFRGPFCITANGAQSCLVAPCSAICAMNTRGDDYLGQFGITRNGENCLKWADDFLPFVRDRDFPDISLDAASNYCRNPAFSQMKPWCYISSLPLRSRRCFIPSCPSSDMEISPHQMTDDEAKNLIRYGSNVARFFILLVSNPGQTELEQVEAAWVDSQCASYRNIFLLYLFIEQEDHKWESIWRHINISCSDSEASQNSSNTTNSPTLISNISNGKFNNYIINYPTADTATDVNNLSAITVSANPPGMFTASTNPPVSGTTMNFTVTTNHPPGSTTTASIPPTSVMNATVPPLTMTHNMISSPALVLNTTNLPPASITTGTILPPPVTISAHPQISVTNSTNSSVAITSATNIPVSVTNTTSHQPVSGTIKNNLPGSGTVTTNPPVSSTVTTNLTVSGTTTTNTQVSGTGTTSITVSGTTTTNPPVSGTDTTNISVSGAITSNLPVSDTITTNTPVSGTGTTNIPVSGTDTTNLPVSNTTTTNVPASGTTTTHLSASGTDTTNLSAAGTGTTIFPVSGTTTANPTVSGTGTTNPPISGTSTTMISVSGTTTTNPPVLGTGTTNPPVSGTGTTSLPVSITIATIPPLLVTGTTNFSVLSTTTTNIPVSGTDTTNIPVSGTDTTNIPVSGTDTTNFLVSGTTTTNPPVSGTGTTNISVSGTGTTNLPVSGTGTTNPPISGTGTTNIPVSSTTTTNPPVSGTGTTYIPDSGTGTTNISVSGTGTTNLPVSGTGTTNPPVSGTGTTNILVSSTTTTNPPVSGTGTTYIPDSDTSTTNISVSGTGTTSPPVSGTGTTNPPVSGSGTTNPPVSGTGSTNILVSDTTTTSPPESGTGTTNIIVPGTTVTSPPVLYSDTTNLPVSVTTTNNLTVSVTSTTDHPVSVPNTTDSPESTQSIATCACDCSHNSNNITSDELERLKEEIKSELTVNKAELSATKRAKTSAVDSRPSATAAGYVGIAMLVMAAFMIAIPDALTLLTHIYCRSE